MSVQPRAMDPISTSRVCLKSLVLLLVLLIGTNTLDTTGCGLYGYRCLNKTHFSVCIENFGDQQDIVAEELQCPPGLNCVEGVPFICGDIIPDPIPVKDTPEEHDERISEEPSLALLPKNQFNISSSSSRKSLTKATATALPENLTENTAPASSNHLDETSAPLLPTNPADSPTPSLLTNPDEDPGNSRKNISQSENQTQSLVDILKNFNKNNTHSKNLTEYLANLLQNVQKNISGPATQTQNLTNFLQDLYANISQSTNLIQKAADRLQNLQKNVSGSENGTQNLTNFLLDLHKNISQSINLIPKVANRLQNLQINVSGSENRTQNLTNFAKDLHKNIPQSKNFTQNVVEFLQRLNINVSGSDNQTQRIIHFLQNLHKNISDLADQKNTTVESTGSIQNINQEVFENINQNSNEPTAFLPVDAPIIIQPQEYPELSLDDYLPADFPDLIKRPEEVLPSVQKQSALPKITHKETINVIQYDIPSPKLRNAVEVPIRASQKDGELPQNAVPPLPLAKQPLSPVNNPEERKQRIQPAIENSKLPNASKTPPVTNVLTFGKSNELSQNGVLPSADVHPVSEDQDIFSADETETTEITTIIPEDSTTSSPDVPARFVCTKSGKFAAPPSCRKYHRCISVGRYFKHQVRSCWHGFHFSPRWRSCVPRFLAGCSKTEVKEIPRLMASEESQESEESEESKESDESNSSE